MLCQTRDRNPAWRDTVILPAFADHLLHLVEPEVNWNALDLACGAGICTLTFARGVATITAIDIKPEQVDECRAAAKEAGLTNVNAIVRDAQELPFESESFDVVTGTGAVSNIDRPEAALSEVRRVLKPEGTLALADFLVPARVQEIYGVLSSLRSKGARRPYLDYPQVMNLLWNTGFQVVNYRPLRWVYPLALATKHLTKDLQDLYERAILNMDEPSKQALRVQQPHWVAVLDCFALTARKTAGRPGWEHEDMVGESELASHPE